MKKIIITSIAIMSMVLLMLIPVNAAISIQQNANWGPNPLDPENGNLVTNLAALSGVTITGDEWASGENRGLACLNDGITVSTSGQSQGWIINYDTVTAKGDAGTCATINFPAGSPQTVSTAVIYASFEYVGYGMPGKFQLTGTLVDDTTVVLYDQTDYEFLTMAGYHGAYRFNFAPTILKSITVKCLAPYTGYTDGKAMPDASVAYWLTEVCLFNDTSRTMPVDVSASDNLAFKATVTSNISNLNKDRPVTDLNNGAGPNPYFGGYLIIDGQAPISSESPLRLTFQYSHETTINNIKVFGRETENSGNLKSFRVKAYSAAGQETVIYDTANAAGYPNVIITPAGSNQPLNIEFPRITTARIVVESWEATPCGDGGVMYWLTEFEMYNNGGAKTINTDKQSIAIDLNGVNTDTIIATLDPASSQTIIWSSTDTNIASVADGVVTGLAVGSCDIIATLADDPTVRKVIPVIVAEGIVAVAGIGLNKDNISIIVNNSDNTLVATIDPENATVLGVDWESDDSNIATVDSTGLVRAVAPGVTVVRAIAKGDETKTAECTVTVTKIAVSAILVTPETITLNVRGKQTLTAEVSPIDATYKGIVWQSEDNDIAVVDAQTGEVTAIKAGASCKIYAISEDDDTISGYCTVSINAIAVSGIYLYLDEAFENELTELGIEQGQSKTIYPYIDPSDATNTEIIWTSSDTAIATVTDGVVAGIMEGVVTITAISAENSELKAEFTLTVTGNNPQTSDNSVFMYISLAIISLCLTCVIVGKKQYSK